MLQQPYSNLRSRLIGTALHQLSRVECGMLRYARCQGSSSILQRTWHCAATTLSYYMSWLMLRVLSTDSP